MNEKALKREIEKKKRELEKIEWELARSRYSRQLDILSESIRTSNTVLRIIYQNNLNVDDTRLLGKMITEGFEFVYEKCAPEIEKNQAKRSRKTN